jgi:hypothetical protein
MWTALVLAASTQVIHLHGVDDLAQGTFDGTALTRHGELVTSNRYAKVGKVPGPALRVLSNGHLLIGAPLRLIDENGETLLNDEQRHMGDACSNRSGVYVAGMPGGLLRYQARSSASFKVVALSSSHRSLWSLHCTDDGVVVAAGQPAALYRIKGTEVVASTKVLGEGLRSVTMVGGNVYAGGLTDGRVWRWSKDQLEVVGVTSKPEVRKLVALTNALAALSVSSENDDNSDLPSPSPQSRGSGVVERIDLVNGVAQTLWVSSGSTPMDMVHEVRSKRRPSEGWLWVASDVGRLHRISVHSDHADARRTHLRTAVGDLRPIEALGWRQGRLTLVGGGLIRQPQKGAHRYRSPVLDAGGHVAHWGNLRVDSQAIKQVRWRFGQAPSPRGWSAWQDAPGGTARYVQLELELKPNSKIRRIEQFVRPINRAPAMILVRPLQERTRLEGKPVDLAYEKGVTLPDDELKDYQIGAQPKPAEERARLTRKEGYRAITWKAEDPDEDPLVFNVSLLRLTSGKTQRLKTWQQTQHYTNLNTSALVHGSYALSVSVRDGQSSWSPASTSQTFRVDHQAPVLSLVAYDLKKKILRIKVRDDDRTVAVRCGSQENFVELIPSDEVADGALEQFVLPLRDWATGLKLQRCEATDPAGNRGGVDLP